MSTQPAASEYSTVREGGVGLIDLSSRGRILVNGSEAVMFLNGLITNDVKALAPNTWMPAAFPNVQGRLLAAVRILNREDGLLIDTEAVTREKVVQLLDRFTLAGDFRVADLTDQTVMFSVQGRQATDVVRGLFGDEAASVGERSVLVVKLGDADVTIIRADHSGESGFDCFAAASDADELREALFNAGVAPVSVETAEVLRIEAGIPRYGIDMDETTVVTETNLDNAISFTKGCYVGQEIIIRIKHRGRVAKKLTGVISDGDAPIERDAKIFSVDDKEIGRVTSSTFSPILNRKIALGYLKYDYLTPGTEIKISSSNMTVNAKVAELPFVRGSWYGTVSGSERDSEDSQG